MFDILFFYKITIDKKKINLLIYLFFVFALFLLEIDFLFEIDFNLSFS